MLRELFNNRNEILKNYLDIFYRNRKWIFMIFTVLLLSLVYAFLCIKEYQQNEIDKLSREVINNLETFQNSKEDNKDDSDGEYDVEDVVEVEDIYEVSKLNYISSMKPIDENEKNYLDRLLKWITDNYLPKMNSVNIDARGFNNIGDAKNKYTGELLDNITTQEKQMIQAFIKENIKKYIKNNSNSANSENKLKWFNNILQKSIITKGQSWLEMGMPHTHDNVIIFGSSWFNSPSWKTLVHECVHTDQRVGIGMDKYRNLYTRWGFQYYDISKIRGMESIVTRNRHNPDAVDCNWIWKCPIDGNHYWIGAVFDSITPSSLSEVSYVGIKLVADGSGKFYYNGSDMRQLNNWKEFKDYFIIDNNEYHPNEIVAEYMSIYFMLNDGVLDSNSNSNVSKLKNSKGFKVFLDWFNNI
jgi:hypothetical protein